ncbi:ABC transporter ATP-binding protein [Gynuella sunshinyii]|uniref:ABC-type antimicrobial peptide transport system, ATPase component n=1 Tax=Gynuella sunshinyii YC6258 TaxID=1445510 RepID=A0A0C5VCV4_9GAMM|nr:ABC transporter ATP-binding protein [Gynuella sunshinyii]AJQ92091.1 ABC-type antimicrobial peptide transport system, ATPase component [Gynuella sunshinyii YC6258]
MTQKIIETIALSRHFGNGDTLVKALDQISLTIHSGEFSAIVGPSGSGKSTLLHLIGGLDQPSNGEIRLSGQAISQMSGSALSHFRRDHIGFIFQAYNLIPVLSAEENVEYIMMLQGIGDAERRERTHAILKRVGLAGKEKRRPAQLSGGQQQRVAVARAMVSQPDIILADEPTANLDSQTGIELLELMKELNEQHGMTFVFSTHDAKIMDRASRLIHLQDGRITTDSEAR